MNEAIHVAKTVFAAEPGVLVTRAVRLYSVTKLPAFNGGEFRWGQKWHRLPVFLLFAAYHPWLRRNTGLVYPSW